jgi:uncharacterized protein DUF3768
MTNDTTTRIRELNDTLRRSTHHIAVRIACGEWVLTRGVFSKGDDFIERAVAAVRSFDDFTEANDPYGEHDFGAFDLDGEWLNWKIDYFDQSMERGSEDPSDATQTRRVLTVLLAEEY